MRTQTVVVTRRCNQHCGFCDRVDPAAIVDPPFERVRDEIVATLAEGVRAIVLSGGEPLLRADLLQLVRVARAHGAEHVTLETNATRIASLEAARALMAAGVSAVQVSVVTTTPERHASLVSPATHPRQILRGMRACLDAGLPVQVRLPLAADLPPAAARIHGLREALPGLAGFVLAPIGAGEATLAPGRALGPEALARELTEAYDTGERLGVAVTLSPDHPVAPCVVDLPLRARRLLATQLREEGAMANGASPACARCALATRCALTAAQLARAAGAHPILPVADPKSYTRPGRNPGSRLRVLGAAEVETFFHVDYEYGVEVERATSRIGIIYRCNQVCTFCELADMDTELPAAKVRTALERSRARGSTRVILTGGEPTLSKDLLDHVRYARELGFAEIELQTNAVLLERPGFAAALREAGLTSAQISLHGPNSAISDRLTAAPGTHQRTLRGVDQLLEAGVRCLLNHLIFRDNCHLLVDFVEMVQQRWGAHRDRIVIQFHSARNEFADREEGLRHIARYSDYAATLRRAIDRGRELGFHVHDLQDPTGIPALCVLGADESYLGPILAQAQRPRFHAWESSWLTRVDACARCDVREACMGVPRYYVALHGDAEFVPIRRDRGAAPLPPER
jgi:molybdenum cofactor biosynthesis enzyme MoaA